MNPISDRRGWWAILVGTFAAGCASSGGVSEDPRFAQGDVDVRPRLLHCGTYVEPRNVTWETETVAVPVVVDADGRVRSVGTPRLSSASAASRTQLSESARETAWDLAEDCVFEPALLEGIPVATGAVVSFRLPY